MTTAVFAYGIYRHPQPECGETTGIAIPLAATPSEAGAFVGVPAEDCLEPQQGWVNGQHRVAWRFAREYDGALAALPLDKAARAYMSCSRSFAARSWPDFVSGPAWIFPAPAEPGRSVTAVLCIAEPAICQSCGVQLAYVTKLFAPYVYPGFPAVPIDSDWAHIRSMRVGRGDFLPFVCGAGTCGVIEVGSAIEDGLCSATIHLPAASLDLRVGSELTTRIRGTFDRTLVTLESRVGRVESLGAPM